VVLSVLKCFKWKLYVCICWLTVEVISCQTSMKLEFSRHIFGKYTNIKFQENPSSGSWVIPCGRTRTDRRTGMMALIVAFFFATLQRAYKVQRTVHLLYVGGQCQKVTRSKRKPAAVDSIVSRTRKSVYGANFLFVVSVVHFINRATWCDRTAHVRPGGRCPAPPVGVGARY